ncbi:hypothetical protein NC652_025949 [Populus alba x Populus x berolinensis]|uniref:Uncharacterized protein n=1 Tax=Populus alba x Populus x berolinensis TaxID=444605 RepID=A0AAD6MC27_9ROSI|nr:hypothetical protein NC652_025949 [Populus alba x Populus x berolinensis]KAJ6982486.1 hypothetical protein NC653_025558 [Populus alba x Populus x berolinensis]
MLIKLNYYIHNKDLENGLTQSFNRIIYELIMSCAGVQVCEINQRRFLATFQSTNGSAPEIAIDPPLTQISFAEDVPAAEQNNIIFASQNQSL